MTRNEYRRRVIDAYLELPDTPERSRPNDRRLAELLHDQGVDLHTARDALLIATARRFDRPSDMPESLPPVRSLAYYRPAIEELEIAPIEDRYRSYLRRYLSRAASLGFCSKKRVS